MSIKKATQIITQTFDDDVFFHLKSVLEWGSFTCALLAILIFGIIAFKNLKLVDRVTLRLQLILCLITFVKSFNRLFVKQVSEGKCIFIGFLINTLDLWHIAFTFSIALNLHLTIIRGLILKKLEIILILSSILVPLIVTLTILGFGHFGEYEFGCSFNEDFLKAKASVFTIIVLPKILVSLYNIIIFLLCVLKAKKTKDLFKNIPTYDPDKYGFILFKVAFLQKLIKRTIAYPMICSIIWSGCIIAGFGVLNGSKSSDFLLIANFEYYYAGMLHFLVFLLDPYIILAFYKLFNTLTYKKNPLHFDLVLLGSHNDINLEAGSYQNTETHLELTELGEKKFQPYKTLLDSFHYI